MHVTQSKNSSTGTGFFIVSICSALYFLWLISGTVFHIPYPQWTGFFVELLTIPLLLGQGVFLVITFIQWRKDEFRKGTLLFWSVLTFFLTTIVCCVSLVYSVAGDFWQLFS
jgi:hypothetical protein